MYFIPDEITYLILAIYLVKIFGIIMTILLSYWSIIWIIVFLCFIKYLKE